MESNKIQILFDRNGNSISWIHAKFDEGETCLSLEYLAISRNSQEATEISLKACLRLVGIEYPKVHDVGDVLVFVKDRYPLWFEREINSFAKLSISLAEKRSAALYGLEVSGKAPGEIFNDQAEAAEVLKEAKKLHRFCTRLITKNGA